MQPRQRNTGLMLLALLTITVLVFLSTHLVKADDIRNSVVLVLCEDESGKPVSIGTGSVISSYQILTANHVVNHCASLSVDFFDEKHRVAKMQWAGKEDNDTAVITASIPEGIKPLKMATKEPTWGEQVTAIGFPYGIPWVLSRGYIASISPVDGFGVLVDITIFKGNSGGPLLNKNNEIVGVASQGLIVSEATQSPIGFNLFILVNRIRSLLPKDLR